MKKSSKRKEEKCDIVSPEDKNCNPLSKNEKKKLTVSICFNSKEKSEKDNCFVKRNVRCGKLPMLPDPIIHNNSPSSSDISDSDLVVISEDESNSSEKASPVSNSCKAYLNATKKFNSPDQQKNSLHIKNYLNSSETQTSTFKKPADKMLGSNISVNSMHGYLDIKKNDKVTSYQSTFSQVNALPEIFLDSAKINLEAEVGQNYTVNNLENVSTAASLNSFEKAATHPEDISTEFNIDPVIIPPNFNFNNYDGNYVIFNILTLKAANEHINEVFPMPGECSDTNHSFNIENIDCQNSATKSKVLNSDLESNISLGSMDTNDTQFDLLDHGEKVDFFSNLNPQNLGTSIDERVFSDLNVGANEMCSEENENLTTLNFGCSYKKLPKVRKRRSYCSKKRRSRRNISSTASHLDAISNQDVYCDTFDEGDLEVQTDVDILVHTLEKDENVASLRESCSQSNEKLFIPVTLSAQVSADKNRKQNTRTKKWRCKKKNKSLKTKDNQLNESILHTEVVFCDTCDEGETYEQGDLECSATNSNSEALFDNQPRLEIPHNYNVSSKSSSRELSTVNQSNRCRKIISSTSNHVDTTAKQDVCCDKGDLGNQTDVNILVHALERDENVATVAESCNQNNEKLFIPNTLSGEASADKSKKQNTRRTKRCIWDTKKRRCKKKNKSVKNKDTQLNESILHDKVVFCDTCDEEETYEQGNIEFSVTNSCNKLLFGIQSSARIPQNYNVNSEFSSQEFSVNNQSNSYNSVKTDSINKTRSCHQTKKLAVKDVNIDDSGSPNKEIIQPSYGLDTVESIINMHSSGYNTRSQRQTNSSTVNEIKSISQTLKRNQVKKTKRSDSAKYSQFNELIYAEVHHDAFDEDVNNDRENFKCLKSRETEDESFDPLICDIVETAMTSQNSDSGRGPHNQDSFRYQQSDNCNSIQNMYVDSESNNAKCCRSSNSAGEIGIEIASNVLDSVESVNISNTSFQYNHSSINEDAISVESLFHVPTSDSFKSEGKECQEYVFKESHTKSNFRNSSLNCVEQEMVKSYSKNLGTNTLNGENKNPDDTCKSLQFKNNTIAVKDFNIDDSRSSKQKTIQPPYVSNTTENVINVHSSGYNTRSRRQTNFSTVNKAQSILQPFKRNQCKKTKKSDCTKYSQFKLIYAEVHRDACDEDEVVNNDSGIFKRLELRETGADSFDPCDTAETAMKYQNGNKGREPYNQDLFGTQQPNSCNSVQNMNVDDVTNNTKCHKHSNSSAEIASNIIDSVESVNISNTSFQSNHLSLNEDAISVESLFPVPTSDSSKSERKECQESDTESNFNSLNCDEQEMVRSNSNNLKTDTLNGENKTPYNTYKSLQFKDNSIVPLQRLELGNYPDCYDSVKISYIEKNLSKENFQKDSKFTLDEVIKNKNDIYNSIKNSFISSANDENCKNNRCKFSPQTSNNSIECVSNIDFCNFQNITSKSLLKSPSNIKGCKCISKQVKKNILCDEKNQSSSFDKGEKSTILKYPKKNSKINSLHLENNLNISLPHSNSDNIENKDSEIDPQIKSVIEKEKHCSIQVVENNVTPGKKRKHSKKEKYSEKSSCKIQPLFSESSTKKTEITSILKTWDTEKYTLVTESDLSKTSDEVSIKRVKFDISTEKSTNKTPEKTESVFEYNNTLSDVNSDMEESNTSNKNVNSTLGKKYINSITESSKKELLDEPQNLVSDFSEGKMEVVNSCQLIINPIPSWDKANTSVLKSSGSKKSNSSKDNDSDPLLKSKMINKIVLKRKHKLQISELKQSKNKISTKAIERDEPDITPKVKQGILQESSGHKVLESSKDKNHVNSFKKHKSSNSKCDILRNQQNVISYSKLVIPPNINDSFNNEVIFATKMKSMKRIPKLSSKGKNVASLNLEESAPEENQPKELIDGKIELNKPSQNNTTSSETGILIDEDLDFEPDLFDCTSIQNISSNSLVEESTSNTTSYTNIPGKNFSFDKSLNVSNNHSDKGAEVNSNSDSNLQALSDLTEAPESISCLNYPNNFKVHSQNRDLPSEDDSDSDHECSFKRLRRDKSNNCKEHSAVMPISKSNLENALQINENVPCPQDSYENHNVYNQNTSYENYGIFSHFANSPEKSANQVFSLPNKDEKSKMTVESPKNKVSNQSIFKIDDVVNRIISKCHSDSVDDAVRILNTYILISTDEVRLQLIKQLFCSLLKLIKEKRWEHIDSSVLKVFDEILNVINEYNFCNKPILSGIIIQCCSHPDLQTFSTKLFYICQKKKIPLSSNALKVFGIFLLTEDVSVPVILNFLDYMKIVCKKDRPKDLVHLALEKCKKFNFNYVHNMCLSLHNISFEEIDAAYLQDFILLCYKNDMWANIAEIFIAWGSRNDLLEILYETILTDSKNMACYFKKLSDFIFGLDLSLFQKNYVGQIGTAFLVSAFSTCELQCALEVLYTLHALNINYFDLQFLAYELFIKEHPENADDYTLKAFPYLVVFMVIDLCISLGRHKDAFTVFEGFAWLIPYKNLDADIKAFLRDKKFCNLLKLAPLLNTDATLKEGVQTLKTLLTSAEQDFTLKDLKKHAKVLQSIFNQYLISLLNSKKIRVIKDLYRYSLRSFKNILTFAPSVLRGLIVTFSENSLHKEVKRLFIIGFIRKIYPIEKPEAENCPWELTVQTNWRVQEIKVAIEWYLEKLSQCIPAKIKNEDFEKWFSITLKFKICNRINSKINCLKAVTSSIENCIRRTSETLEQIRPSLKFIHEAENNCIKITPDSFYEFWMSRSPEAPKKQVSSSNFLERDQSTIAFGKESSSPTRSKSPISSPAVQQNSMLKQESLSLHKDSPQLPKITPIQSPDILKSPKLSNTIEEMSFSMPNSPGTPKNKLSENNQNTPSASNNVPVPKLSDDRQITRMQTSSGIRSSVQLKVIQTSTISKLPGAINKDDNDNFQEHICSPQNSLHSPKESNQNMLCMNSQNPSNMQPQENIGSFSIKNSPVASDSISTSIQSSKSSVFQKVRLPCKIAAKNNQNDLPKNKLSIATLNKKIVKKKVKINNKSRIDQKSIRTKNFPNFTVSLTPDTSVRTVYNQPPELCSTLPKEINIDKATNQLDESVNNVCIDVTQVNPLFRVTLDNPRTESLPVETSKQINESLSDLHANKVEVGPLFRDALNNSIAEKLPFKTTVNVNKCGSRLNTHKTKVGSSCKVALDNAVPKRISTKPPQCTIPTAGEKKNISLSSKQSMPKEKITFSKTIGVNKVSSSINSNIRATNISSSQRSCAQSKCSKPVINRNFSVSVNKDFFNDVSTIVPQRKSISNVDTSHTFATEKPVLNTNDIGSLKVIKPQTGVLSCSKEEFTIIIKFLKIKILQKYKHLTSSQQHKKAEALAQTFVEFAFIDNNKLDNRTKKLLVEFAISHV